MLAGSLCLFACSEDSPDPDPCLDNAPTISSLNATPGGCNQQNGSLVVNAAGGTEPLQFSINGGAFQASNTFGNLAAGNYTITVKDANNCQASAEQSITEESDIAATAQIDAHAGCGASAGALTVTASGGAGNHTFSINGTDFQESPSFTNLAAGSYTITVKDEANCSATSTVQLLTGISFEGSIKAIIDTKCATTGCHVSGTNLPDFTNFANIKSNAASVKSLTQSGAMPKTGSLTQAEIDAIACWVDDGALNN